jgi:hypothetical protein
MEGLMKCAVEMGSGAMIYIPSFIKIDSGVQMLFRTQRQQCDLISIHFLKTKESRLKIEPMRVKSDFCTSKSSTTEFCDVPCSLYSCIRYVAAGEWLMS